MVGHDVPEDPGEGGARLLARPDHHEAPDRLALQWMRHADRGRLRDRRMRGERALHLCRPQTLARDRQRVVGPTVEEPEPVLVDAWPSRRGPRRRGSDASRSRDIAPDRPDPARHRGPRLPADELPDLAGGDRSPRIHDVDVHAERRAPSVHGLSSQIGRRREEAGPDLGAAAQVDDREPRPPTSRCSHRYGSGFHGSPVEARIRSEDTSWRRM